MQHYDEMSSQPSNTTVSGLGAYMTDWRANGTKYGSKKYLVRSLMELRFLLQLYAHSVNL